MSVGSIAVVKVASLAPIGDGVTAAEYSALRADVDGYLEAIRIEDSNGGASANGYNIAAGFSGNDIAAGCAASTIAGGGTNTNEQIIAAGSFNTIGGGYDDQITSTGIGASTIAGGAHHEIGGTATHATIGGGSFGTINGASDYSTIGGGTVNSIEGADQGTIGGGGHGLITSAGGNGTIGGGDSNVVAALRGVVAGGTSNVVASSAASIVGGDDNAIKGSEAAISGGQVNTIGPCRVFLDAVATASSTTVTCASGDFAGGDVGATVYISGCGVQLGVHVATITAVNSATSITISVAPPNSRSGQVLTLIGTGTAADYASIGGGLRNKVTGQYGRVDGGRENLASADYAQAAGFYAKADKYGQLARASGRFAAQGDAQTSVLTVRRTVTTAAANTMLTDGSVGRVTIADDTTWAFSVLLVARRTDADNESAAYKLEGCIDRNAGTVALVGTVTKTVLAEDTAAWDCDATADNVNKALSITFTGEVGKTINAVARVTLVEVTG